MKFPKNLILMLAAVAWTLAVPAFAQPTPAPDPGGPPSVFYGGIAPNANSGPVVVFVHGLGTNAQFWWGAGNRTYEYAYQAGYRTAFISMSGNNGQNTSSVATNAATFTKLLPVILQRYGVTKVYLVCHSKGGLDVQLAMVNSATVRAAVKAIFTVATPNQGAYFASWVYTPEGQTWVTENHLESILSEGMQSIGTSEIAPLRATADELFKRESIPFITLTGTKFTGPDVVMAISGAKLQQLKPDQENDGLVLVSESKLPNAYAFDDASQPDNHIQMAHGRHFDLIKGRIDGLEAMYSGYSKLATGGFGDSYNTWAWSMRWFKGNLYVGTARAMQCVTIATSDAQTGGEQYPPFGNIQCTPDPKDLPLAAEIWRFNPTSKLWSRAYQAPVNIPIGNNASGQPVSTSPDLGYRSLYIYKENAGTPQENDVLYAGGVSPNCIFGKLPEFPNNSFPAPRILRSVDGVTWTPIPANPGTFMGDLIKNNTDINVVSFRSFETINGKLHAVVTNLRGEGFVIAAKDNQPWLGDDHWERVSPSVNDLHVWALKGFNNQIYAVGGDREAETGYTVHKTTGAKGSDGYYVWTPVILNGGWQTNAQMRSPVALTVETRDNMLWVGTNRKTELIRIRPDDTWDVVVGYPRQVPADGSASGATGDLKKPISGIMNYFANVFNAHFWQMKDSSEGMYLATYDESIQVQQSSTINPFFNAVFGFDLLSSTDGVFWKQAMYNGFYDGANFGGRSMESTPFGFVLGTARNTGGTQIYISTRALDLNKDGIIDQQDVNLLNTAVAAKQAPTANDVRDLDRDGKLTMNDATLLAGRCTFVNCAGLSPNALRKATAAVTAPSRLISLEGTLPAVPNSTPIQLTWSPVTGAVRYHIFRMTHKTLGDLLPGGGTISATLPELGTVTLPGDALNGRLDAACKKYDTSWCDLLPALKSGVSPAATATLVGFPSAPIEVATTTTTSWSSKAPTQLQSIYWIRAEDAMGNLSEASNIVGAPALTTVR